ncbi:MAG: helix-turn-helix domain-containing protein [Chakrabartia sp.]
MVDNTYRGSTLDSFLEDEGVLAEFQARAIKEVVAWQLAEAMKDRKITKTALAGLMKTSRTQINRVLDPNDGNVTIETLQRAAALVGRRVQLELV